MNRIIMGDDRRSSALISLKRKLNLPFLYRCKSNLLSVKREISCGYCLDKQILNRVARKNVPKCYARLIKYPYDFQLKFF